MDGESKTTIHSVFIRNNHAGVGNRSLFVPKDSINIIVNTVEFAKWFFQFDWGVVNAIAFWNIKNNHLASHILSNF